MAEALKAEGNALVGLKDWAGAAQKYTEAIAIDSSKPAYHSNLALCYEKLNNPSAFKEAALKCIEVDPSFIKGYYRLAKAHSLLWEYEQQVSVIERGLEIDSTNVDLLKMLQTATRNRDNMARYEQTTLTPYAVRCYFGGGATNNIPTDVSSVSFVF